MSEETGRRSILIVDDEPQILTALEDLLEDKYRVIVHEDAEDALDCIHDPSLGAILCDQRMPGLSGDQFLSMAAANSPAARILITGYADMEAVVRGVNQGRIYAYVAKPWEPKDLLSLISRGVEYCDLQQELIRERELLHTLMNNIPDTIYFKDRFLRFERLNQGLATLLQLKDPAEGKEKTALDLFPEEYAQQAHIEEEELLISGRPIIGKEEKLETPDGGSLWWSTTKVPIKDRSDSPIGLIGISRDISKAKANEQALVHKTQELIRYNKELERFAFIASHDLQEPLRKVRTFAGLVAARSAGKLDEQSQQYLGHLQDAAQRMQTLIRDLLAMSRLTSRARPFSRVDLNAVVQRVLADLDLSIQETGAKLEVAQLPEIDADPTQMQQLFQNLFANALKFHDKERPLVVRITLDSLRDPGRHQIAVEDNGIGFDPKYSERIFEVFQRLHSQQEYGGTGIGLAICQRIVERHDGSIEAHGRPGAGSTFVVSLPSRGVEMGEGS